MEFKPTGKYFEDFEVGQEDITPARTVTETDIMNFCGLSGDFNPLHTVEPYAKNTIFGGRIAHGPLVTSIASGLIARTGFFEGTTVAFLGYSWRFNKPVKIGDTIYVRIKVKETRPTKPGRGIVSFDTETLNDRDEVVVTGTWDMMMFTRERLS